MNPTSPSSAPDEQPIHAGFSLPIDMVVAPGRAFLKIAKTSEWIPALVVVLALGAGTIALATPAFVHIFAGMKISPPQSQSDVIKLLSLELLAYPPLIAMMIAVTLTAMTRVKDPTVPFVRYYSLALNCWVPSALGTFLHAAVAALRQPEAFAGMRQYALALPDNLAVLSVPGNDQELNFLGSFNIWDTWTYVLLGFGISLFTGMRFGVALPLAVVIRFFVLLIFGQ